MSGGVDSSVAAALALEAGHEVVGATLKLWGGASDSGCCSVADVEDARHVADQLGVAHHVFNYTELFEDHVVGPYVDGHRQGRTPNPCIECNRHVKFGALLARARRLGFDALATGHHARLRPGPLGPRLVRGADRDKDQSYVLSMLGRGDLGFLLFPVGALTKAEVRGLATRLGLGTADKPDSQDVCFIHSSTGRAGFLAERAPLHAGVLVDAVSGQHVGKVDAVELVTVGQRRGLGLAVDGRRRFALSVDVEARQVSVGPPDMARSRTLLLDRWTWVDAPLPVGARAMSQTSAHGRPVPCTLVDGGIVFDEVQRLVAPGQTVALYDIEEPEAVTGSAVAIAP